MMNSVVATDIRTEIERANEKFMETYRRGDAMGMAMLYTHDGMVLPPNGDFVEGREQIQSFWQGVMDMGIKSITLQIREVEQQADAAFEVSRATLSDEKGQALDQAKYIVIWKKENGEWKLHRDIFNSSLPR
jgi:uncharacterized protein (TIGR02246 family)